MAASSSIVRYNTPCAACKFLRRKCMPDCIFAPYFPPEEPLKFSQVHKIFGASNVSKLLNEVLPYQREDTVSTLAYEAEARVRDPVYGSVGVISSLQLQIERLQKDLDAANTELIHNACGCNQFCYNYPHQNFSAAALPAAATSAVPIYPNYAQVRPQITRPVDMRGSGISYHQTPSKFSFPWNDNNVSGQGGGAGQGL